MKIRAAALEEFEAPLAAQELELTEPRSSRTRSRSTKSTAALS